MAKSLDIVARRGSAAIRVEHVKRRKVLRLTAWDDKGEVGPLEIALPGLLDKLDIDPAEVSAPVRYLLFGGRHDEPRGGADDLVGTFDSEEAARQAFLELRAGRPDSEGWGDLTALDGRGRLTHVAWFGRHQVSAALADRPAPVRNLWFRSRPTVLSIAGRGTTAC